MIVSTSGTKYSDRSVQLHMLVCVSALRIGPGLLKGRKTAKSSISLA